MRTLLLMRGAPGCGKSTWIKQHNLENYALEPDEIRMMYSSPQMQVDGTHAISQDIDDRVWTTLFEILESRLERGEFTVIDATNSKTKDMTRYKDLCDKYRYRMYCVDFTDIPLERCLKQNKMRDNLKHVPEDVIRNIYARFANQKIPGGIKVIKPNEFDTILERPFDLSNYEKIVHIGDIHGCYDTLMQYFNDFPINDKTEYIFCGDYLDRGNQNAEVFKFLDSIKDLPNVCLLQGNHEWHIQKFGNEERAVSKEFEHKTKPQLENADITSKDARMFFRKIRQCSYYKYNDIEVLACHGGIPSMDKNLLYIPANAFIKGVGEYEDYKAVAENWMDNTKPNQYLIHGHRNTSGDETRICDRVFNLEGGVEFGGQLRIVELTKDGFKCLNYDNIQPVKLDEVVNKKDVSTMTVEEAIGLLQGNRFVQEKQLGKNISSFNFTRLAFEKKNWDAQTILARGFFVNTLTKEIVARSYEKFFRIDENFQTRMSNLRTKLAFPVTAYVKENGYLGIVSYDKVNDELFIASKSTNKGDFADKIKDIIDKKYDKIKIIDYLKDKNETLVFEVISPEFDPHIIEYDEEKLVLLDSIFNTLEFNKRSYSELGYISGLIGIERKKIAYSFASWNDFYNFYNVIYDNYDYQYKGKYIEGFVFEDSEGFMVKMKTEYYNEWKKLRGLMEPVLRLGYTTKTGQLFTEMENHFYGYCRDLYNNYYNKEYKGYPFKTDIISLRKGFLEKN